MTARNQTISHIVSVTPDDDADLPNGIAVGFHVNADGDIKFDDAFGSTITLSVLAGVNYPYEVKKIYDTGTDATGIHALYW